MDNEMIVEGWQPIETAPKGDDPVLIYCGGEGQFVARRMGSSNAYEPRYADDQTETFPTHWMPLPNPPSS